MYGSFQVTSKRLGQSVQALQRYNRKSSVITEDVVALYQIAATWLDKEFGPYMCGAIIHSYDHAREWLKNDTSAGLPWTARYATKLDYHYSQDADFTAKYWDVLATEEYIRSLCSVSEKVELRPKEKVDAGRVRTTISMDVNHVTSHHRMCHDEDARLMAGHRFHPIKLGMDMFNGGFDDLNRWMTPWGDEQNVIELDGDNFDGRWDPLHFDIIHKFRYRMLHPKHQSEANYLRLRNIYSEIIRAPFVDVTGFVYERDGGGVGTTSGHKCTTSDNALKNYLDMAVMFMLATGNHSYDDYKRLVRSCIVGDDINIAVHKSIHEFLNARVIERLATRIGMKYHFASMDFRFNHECQFLGHSFRECYVPHLGYSMFFPCIDGHKMRCSLLHYNEAQTIPQTIVRACSLRTETFPDVIEREWFRNFLTFMQRRYPPSDPRYRDVWKNYKSDYELWVLYSGFGK